jgi:hypothetical protein
VRGKPAGSVVRLSRFKWHGDDDPALGMWLVTDAGSAYEVTGIEETARSARGNDPRLFNFVCRKAYRDDVPADAFVAEMYWDKR